MRPIVNLDECIRDSPKFREALEENEENIDQLESKLDRLVRLCSTMVETGKNHVAAQSGFINGIWDLVGYFKDDVSIVNSLNRFIQILTDVLKYQSILLDQAQRSVIKNLNNFIKNDIRQSKETRRHFEKMSDDLDNALFRNSAVPRSKPVECEDAHNVLIATRSCFQHLALDYVHQLSCLQSKKRHEVLQTLLSLMSAYSTYYHQGYDLFEDSEPFLKQLGGSRRKWHLAGLKKLGTHGGVDIYTNRRPLASPESCLKQLRKFVHHIMDCGCRNMLQRGVDMVDTLQGNAQGPEPVAP